MNLDLTTLITPSVLEVIRLLAIIGALLHLLVGVVLFRQVLTMLSLISSRRSALVRLFALVHILFLVAILVLVILV